MLFKNILVPHDGSGHSKHAFKVALDMAKKYNSKLSMVTVLDTSTGYWANARVELSDWNGARYTDQFTLLKENDAWSITSKVFHLY